MDYKEKVMEHYSLVAKEDGASCLATMKDEYVRDSETRGIRATVQAFKKIKQEELSVLDVGCGNGYTLSVLKNEFPNFVFCGIEKNDDLRKIANQRLNSSGVQVHAGDILDVSKSVIGTWDVVICQRVLINLLEVNDQINALHNIETLVKDDGILILIEGMNGPLNNLNEARAEFGLQKIAPSFHNLYLDSNMLPSGKDGFVPFHEEGMPVNNFLSTHYYVSRVLHDVALHGRDFSYNSPFVKFFSEAISVVIGDYSPVKFYAFRKTNKISAGMSLGGR